MFSITTMASSTTKPVEIVSAVASHRRRRTLSHSTRSREQLTSWFCTMPSCAIISVWVCDSTLGSQMTEIEPYNVTFLSGRTLLPLRRGSAKTQRSRDKFEDLGRSNLARRAGDARHQPSDSRALAENLAQRFCHLATSSR